MTMLITIHGLPTLASYELEPLISDIMFLLPSYSLNVEFSENSAKTTTARPNVIVFIQPIARTFRSASKQGVIQSAIARVVRKFVARKKLAYRRILVAMLPSIPRKDVRTFMMCRAPGPP